MADEDVVKKVERALADLDSLMPPPSRTITLDTPTIRALVARVKAAETALADMGPGVGLDHYRAAIADRDAIQQRWADLEAWISKEDGQSANDKFDDGYNTAISIVERKLTELGQAHG